MLKKENKSKDLVKVYYPFAFCKRKEFGKSYYQVVSHRDGRYVLGQGKSKRAAWKSAYRNVYGHR